MTKRAYIHDEAPPEAQIHPVAKGASQTVNGSAITMEGFDAVMFILLVGAGDKTVDAKVQKDTASGFASPTDITGAAITQLGTTDTNKVCVISVMRPSEGFTRLVVTTGAGGSADRVIAATAVKFNPSGRIPVTDLADEVVEVVDAA